MKTHIALGATLLLTLGSAVAGSLLYGQARSAVAVSPTHSTVAADEVTPAMIANWKDHSSSFDYIAPKVPI
jgi:hypothetical protein